MTKETEMSEEFDRVIFTDSRYRYGTRGTIYVFVDEGLTYCLEIDPDPKRILRRFHTKIRSPSLL